MGFVKSVAKTGLLGIPAMAIAGAFKKDKPKPQQSLVTGDYPSQSLINSKPTVY